MLFLFLFFPCTPLTLLHLKDDYSAISLNIKAIYREDVTVVDFIMTPQFRNKDSPLLSLLSSYFPT